MTLSKTGEEGIREEAVLRVWAEVQALKKHPGLESESSVKRSRVELFLCAVIAEMDLAVNNLINSLFITRGLGADGAAAYELVVPCLMVVSAFMALGYNGIQAVCAKDYGAQDREAFERHKNAGYSWMILVMATLTVLFALLRETILDFLGTGDAGTIVAGLSRACYLMFLPCFLLQGYFCIASCLLFLKERRQLVTANLILYACTITGNILITRFHPTMTAYIAMNALSEAAADVYLMVYFFRRRNTSLAAFTKVNLRLRDVKDILLTGLPDWLEYVFAGILSLVLNLYVLARFSPSLVAGIGIFEAIENIPEMLCVGFCFLVTAGLGTRVGRVIAAQTSEEDRAAEDDLHRMARLLTKGAIVGGLAIAVLLVVLAHPIANAFFTGAGDSGAVESAVYLLVSYAVGFVFYLLNYELVCYYKLVEAFPFAHAAYFAETLLFPLLARIVLGELFGMRGFCLGGALGEALALVLNLFFIGKACGHFPRKLADFRMDRHLKSMQQRAQGDRRHVL